MTIGAERFDPEERWVEGPAGVACPGEETIPEGDGSACSTTKFSTLSRGSRARLIGGLGAIGGYSLKMSSVAESTWREALPKEVPSGVVSEAP